MSDEPTKPPVLDRIRVGSAPDSWGVWFPDDPQQTPWHRFLDEVAEAGGIAAWVRPDAADLQALADLADAGKLTVPVTEVFALEDVAKAFALSQGGHVRGKIAIEVSR